MPEAERTDSTISRRDFARRAALAAATAACWPGDLLARTGAPPELQEAPAQPKKLSPESQAEVDMKIQAIFRKYGNRLSDTQKVDIHRLVIEGQEPLEKMRAFPLDNSDEPGNVLKLYPDATAARTTPSR
jgi:hypothetical protein